MKPLHLYFAGGAVALIGLVLFLQKNNAKTLGAAAGSAAVGAVVGVASGAANTVIDSANDPAINPLHGFGAWLGGTIYDLTHWK